MTRWYETALIASSVLIFALWCLLILGLAGLPGRGLDFRIFYTAASLPLDELYHLNHQVRFQRELWKAYGEFVPSPFPRPAFYALLLKPIGWFDYATSLHLWLVALVGAFVAVGVWMRKLYGAGYTIFLLLVTFYPVSVALRNGQDSSFLLLALLLAIHCHRRGRDWMAALLVGLCFEKFNLVFLLPVALFFHRKARWLARLIACGASLTALSLALIGRVGVGAYGELLTDGSLDALFNEAWNIRTLIWRLGWNQALYLTATALVLAWMAWIIRRGDFETSFWLAAAAAPLISWHSYAYDYVVALPALYLLWARYRVFLSGLFLHGGLWPHFALTHRISWVIALLMIAMTIELYWRTRGTSTGKHLDDPESPRSSP